MLRLAFALLVFAALTGCRDAAPDSPPEATPVASIPFDIAGDLTFYRDDQPITTIAIEVADTDSLRMRGMMDRTVIPEATGMLFIFPNAAPQSFWMQSTPSALDIMYFGADSTLINVQANAVPFQTDPTYPSEGPAQFVVETPAGFARRYGLTPGVRIGWALSGSKPLAPEATP